jgi:hypothetical protein
MRSTIGGSTTAGARTGDGAVTSQGGVRLNHPPDSSTSAKRDSVGPMASDPDRASTASDPNRALDPPTAEPRLSVVLVAGPLRPRAQRVVDALGEQTVRDEIEIIVVDLAPEGMPRLEIASGMRATYLRRSRSFGWSRARAAGVHLARAPIVAFIEDHCYPAPGWAKALIEAHGEGWAAVGYAFTNANPETWLGRAALVNDYGFWMHPARRGPTTVLPNQNVSYKRDLLLSFGEQLETILTPDFTLHQVLLQRGLGMFVESRALAAHDNATHLPSLTRGHLAFARLLGARRAKSQSWGPVRRIVYGVLAPPVLPVLQALRLFASLRGRASLWPSVLAAMPVYLAAHLGAALGESQGYFFGEGRSELHLAHMELEVERGTR